MSDGRIETVQAPAQRSGTGTVPRPRLDSLTGLRWWAAFGVFIFHMRIFAPVPGLSAVAPFGNYGVAFFFILSGFVLTWSARPGTTVRNFYWRRFARIYPAHFVALLLAIPVFYHVLPGQPEVWWIKPFSLGIILLSVPLIQGWFSEPAILFSGNPAAWTLTVEFFFYAIHPLVHRMLRPLRIVGISILITAVVLVGFGYQWLVFAGGEGWWQHVPVPITRVSEFIIGMGIALLLRARPGLRVRPFWGYLLIAVFVFGLICLKVTGAAPELARVLDGFTAQILVVLFALLILAVATRDIHGGRSFLRKRWMVRLGEWSFAFYLMHATVMYAMMTLVGPQSRSIGNLAWYPLLFALALLAAWLLYRLVEHPFEAVLRRFGDRRFSEPWSRRNRSLDRG